MALNIKNGLVQINETSEDRIINFHLKRGFAMLTAFRSEYSLGENRSRNRQLANDLKQLGYSYVKVTGGYIETITPDNPNWEDADVIPGRGDIRQLPIMEESFLVTMFNIKTNEVADYETFKDEQDKYILYYLLHIDSILDRIPIVHKMLSIIDVDYENKKETLKNSIDSFCENKNDIELFKQMILDYNNLISDKAN